MWPIEFIQFSVAIFNDGIHYLFTSLVKGSVCFACFSIVLFIISIIGQRELILLTFHQLSLLLEPLLLQILIHLLPSRRFCELLVLEYEL